MYNYIGYIGYIATYVCKHQKLINTNARKLAQAGLKEIPLLVCAKIHVQYEVVAFMRLVTSEY